MTERELQDAVIELARTLGFLVHHDRPARTSKGWRTAIQGDPGFPDLVLAHPKTRRVIFAELKATRGYATPNQQRWLVTLPNSFLWVPNDWTDGIIEMELRRSLGVGR